MKLDRKTVARLALPAGKSDVIVFDELLPGFGLRLRRAGGQVRKSWIVQYRRAGRSRRLLLGSAEVERRAGKDGSKEGSRRSRHRF